MTIHQKTIYGLLLLFLLAAWASDRRTSEQVVSDQLAVANSYLEFHADRMHDYMPCFGALDSCSVVYINRSVQNKKPWVNSYDPCDISEWCRSCDCEELNSRMKNFNIIKIKVYSGAPLFLIRLGGEPMLLLYLTTGDYRTFYKDDTQVYPTTYENWYLVNNWDNTES